MAVNQPRIKEDPIDASWDLEVTNNINTAEQRLNALLAAIANATSLEDLKERTSEI